MTGTFKGLRSFLVLWLGQSLSQLGSAMTAFALNIWAFQQEGTVMSVALLCVCNYVPAALVSLIAGPWVDRHGKKAIMLVADSISALMTVTVLLLSTAGRLQVGHLYAINACLGICGAFQGPASSVAVSLLVPRDQYMRTSGLQSLSGSLLTVLSPIFATAVLAFGGLRSVLTVDLVSFAFAFLSLAILRIPEPRADAAQEEGFAKRFQGGLLYLRNTKAVREIVWYLGLINLVAGISYYSVLNPMILARTGGNELILGYVTSCVGLGMVTGAMLLTWKSPKCRLVTQMCISYMLSFMLCDFWLGVGRIWPVWCVATFLGNLPIPFGDGALTTLLRLGVPVGIQGRVFSVRDCLVKLATTLGYLAGAILADKVCEPLVSASGALRKLIGEGDGRAMGLVFLITGITGILASVTLMRSRSLRGFEKELQR